MEISRNLVMDLKLPLITRICAYASLLVTEPGKGFTRVPKKCLFT